MAPTKNDWILTINEHIKTMRVSVLAKVPAAPRGDKIHLERFYKACSYRRDALVDEIASEVTKSDPEMDINKQSIEDSIVDFESRAYGEFVEQLVEAVEDLSKRLQEEQDNKTTD